MQDEPRRMYGGKMKTEAQIAQQLASNKAWSVKNTDKVKIYQKNYRAKHWVKKKQYQREYDGIEAKEGTVYVWSHPYFGHWKKLGATSDTLDIRLNKVAQYMPCPNLIEILVEEPVSDVFAVEARAHALLKEQDVPNDGEWYETELATIASTIADAIKDVEQYITNNNNSNSE